MNQKPYKYTAQRNNNSVDQGKYFVTAKEIERYRRQHEMREAAKMLDSAIKFLMVFLFVYLFAFMMLHP